MTSGPVCRVRLLLRLRNRRERFTSYLSSVIFIPCLLRGFKDGAALIMSAQLILGLECMFTNLSTNAISPVLRKRYAASAQPLVGLNLLRSVEKHLSDDSSSQRPKCPGDTEFDRFETTFVAASVWPVSD